MPPLCADTFTQVPVLPTTSLVLVLHSSQWYIKQGKYPQNCRVLLGNWDHRLADSNCWNIDLLADLAEIILIII